MLALIPVILKDSKSVSQIICNVPLEYTVSQLLGELIEAGGLDYIEPSGQKVRYQLFRAENEPLELAPHTTFRQAQVLRGDGLILRRVLSRETVPPALLRLHQLHWQDDDYVELEESSEKEASGLPEYWKQALKFEAAQATEKALLTLLQRWHEIYRQQRPRLAASAANPLQDEFKTELTILRQEIDRLLKALVEERAELTSYNEFYNVLSSEAFIAFLAVEPDQREYLLQRLTQSSYLLARHQLYSNARDLAALALQLDPANETAITLELMARQYVTLQGMEDGEDRLELARGIFQIDEHYGSIANDLRAIVARQRSSRARKLEKGQPETIRPSRPTPARRFSIKSPLKKPGRSLFQKYYLWILGVLMTLTFMLLIYWIAVAS